MYEWEERRVFAKARKIPSPRALSTGKDAPSVAPLFAPAPSSASSTIPVLVRRTTFCPPIDCSFQHTSHLPREPADKSLFICPTSRKIMSSPRGTRTGALAAPPSLVTQPPGVMTTQCYTWVRLHPVGTKFTKDALLAIWSGRVRRTATCGLGRTFGVGTGLRGLMMGGNDLTGSEVRKAWLPDGGEAGRRVPLKINILHSRNIL
ncbi:hypothetical protein BDK51DRAFT_31330 [Blyttiomyces helicus]|uniref:Uncharacterized protein n=1 Tax=Blyttiomyces helicus TaxID=388810 RepID=A0A4P9WRJ3_9FUNG|nr:hypothetical protein BDK51DRAFT_31330 [Blyttiomyces helicus]|eukprot:RKO93900.1 hypothetical protein BDK51DRAFT_31330 [Blyttiomyces helicus]